MTEIVKEEDSNLPVILTVVGLLILIWFILKPSNTQSKNNTVVAKAKEQTNNQLKNIEEKQALEIANAQKQEDLNALILANNHARELEEANKLALSESEKKVLLEKQEQEKLLANANAEASTAALLELQALERAKTQALIDAQLNAAMQEQARLLLAEAQIKEDSKIKFIEFSKYGSLTDSWYTTFQIMEIKVYDTSNNILQTSDFQSAVYNTGDTGYASRFPAINIYDNNLNTFAHTSGLDNYHEIIVTLKNSTPVSKIDIYNRLEGSGLRLEGVLCKLKNSKGVVLQQKSLSGIDFQTVYM